MAKISIRPRCSIKPPPKETVMKPPVVLYRKGCLPFQEDEQEIKAAEKHFHVVYQRTNVQRNDLVVARYSTYPFYKELDEDLKNKGATLINSISEHQYIADLQNWASVDLKDYTPQTWYRLEDVPDGGGPFVLKGYTNSKKNQWSTHCFATNKQEAIETYIRLQEDGLIGQQPIYIRQYVPLKTYMKNITGQPVTDEYRFFAYKNEILSGGYYWSNFVDELKEQGYKLDPNSVPRDWLQKVVNIIAEHTNFFAVDVAQTESGEYILVEINCGTMSGLSENDPNDLYKNLKDILWTRSFKITP